MEMVWMGNSYGSSLGTFCSTGLIAEGLLGQERQLSKRGPGDRSTQNTHNLLQEHHTCLEDI